MARGLVGRDRRVRLGLWNLPSPQYAVTGSTVASIVARAAALPNQFAPKLFQVFVSGVDEKALIEFPRRPLPAIDIGTQEFTVAQRYPGRTIEASIVSTVVEKDLGGEALVQSSKDGGFTVMIRMGKAKIE
ncbi:MAG: hypothetical protein E4H20_08265 [Spirochaetales bacterium]|nr:MAG: hypothetical protein E4H20_08265 [Spirochaetales bacterium]